MEKYFSVTGFHYLRRDSSDNNGYGDKTSEYQDMIE